MFSARVSLPPSAPGGLPYWRLSGFYFCYFAALGAFMPYWALYLQAQGYSPAQIGQIMALLAATKLVSPNFWGWLADRSDRAMRWIRISSLLTAVSFGLLNCFSGFAWMAMMTGCVGIFWNAPLPLFEAVTLNYLQRDSHRYSRIRLWGSIGFIVAVIVLGKALDTVLVIDGLPTLILALFIAMAVTTLMIPGRSVRATGVARQSLWSILHQPEVVACFLVFMLVQLAHGPHYVFYSIYLQDSGYDSSQTGLLWSLGVLAEVLLFVWIPQLLRRHSLRSILLVSLVLSIMRWLLIAWLIQNVYAVVFAQLLHAASFGAVHVVAIQLVHRYFAGPHFGKGQSLYSSLSYGLGGMLGSYYSGQVWNSWGPEIVYSSAAGFSLLALLIVWIWVERNPKAGSVKRQAA